MKVIEMYLKLNTKLIIFCDAFQDLFNCAAARKEGIYRRKKRIMTFDPYNEAMRAMLEKKKREVYLALGRYHFKDVWIIISQYFILNCYNSSICERKKNLILMYSTSNGIPVMYWPNAGHKLQFFIRMDSHLWTPRQNLVT